MSDNRKAVGESAPADPPCPGCGLTSQVEPSRSEPGRWMCHGCARPFDTPPFRSAERARLFWKQLAQASRDVAAWPDYLKRAFQVSAPASQDAPLSSRLRTEAAEWDAGEDIAPLLVEAAEAIELLAAHVATLTWEKRRPASQDAPEQTDE